MTRPATTRTSAAQPRFCWPAGRCCGAAARGDRHDSADLERRDLCAEHGDRHRRVSGTILCANRAAKRAAAGRRRNRATAADRAGWAVLSGAAVRGAGVGIERKVGGAARHFGGDQLGAALCRGGRAWPRRLLADLHADHSDRLCLWRAVRLSDGHHDLAGLGRDHRRGWAVAAISDVCGRLGWPVCAAAPAAHPAAGRRRAARRADRAGAVRRAVGLCLWRNYEPVVLAVRQLGRPNNTGRPAPAWPKRCGATWRSTC